MAKILLVDDNKDSNRLMKDVIESWNYDVILASEGNEAMRLLTEVLPDLIILDVMIPGKSGYEICHEIKNDAKYRQIPVVFLTALSDEDDRIHGYNVGANLFLTKPVKHKELKAVIEKLLVEKSYFDVTESMEAVSNLLEAVMHQSAKKGVNNDKLISKEKIYCKRMAEEGNLSAYSKVILNIALELQNLPQFFDSLQDGKIIWSAYKEMNLFRLLDPVFEYHVNYGHVSPQIAENLTYYGLQMVADIFHVIRIYGDIYLKNKSIEKTLVALHRKALANECDEDVAARLSVIIEHENILLNIENSIKKEIES